MEEFFINTIQEFNDYNRKETLHPLISVVHVDSTDPIKECMMHYGVYAIFLKENKGCKLSYGRTPYDFDEMTVTSFAPSQVVNVEPSVKDCQWWLILPTNAACRLVISARW